MSAGRTTVMLLVPGRSTLCLELDARWPFALVALLALPLLMGATARRCLDGLQGHGASLVELRELTGSMQALQPAGDSVSAALLGSIEDRDRTQAFVAVASRGTSPEPRAMRATDVVNAQQVVRMFAPSRAATPAPVDDLGNGWLRLQALHLGESVRVRPFDDGGNADPAAFDALRHLMRCRITGDEIAIDPRLVRILVQISATYNRPIELVSGHRTPNVIGTHPTSQHTLGKAADIRVPGIGIEQLRSLALQLGARGVGLYPEKGFVHVDVRDKNKYRWIWTEAAGEQADMH